jgi:hypothetical protein
MRAFPDTGLFNWDSGNIPDGLAGEKCMNTSWNFRGILLMAKWSGNLQPGWRYPEGMA